MELYRGGASADHGLLRHSDGAIVHRGDAGRDAHAADHADGPIGRTPRANTVSGCQHHRDKLYGFSEFVAEYGIPVFHVDPNGRLDSAIVRSLPEIDRSGR